MGRRAGRKRKQGAREKNGQPQRKGKAERVEEAVRIARAMPHRRGFASNDRTNELAGTALGRLRLTRIGLERRWRHDADIAKFRAGNIAGIGAAEYAAGDAYAAIVGKYRSVIEGPRAVRSLSIATSAEPGDAPAEQGIADKFACPSDGADPIERPTRIGGKTLTTRTWPCGASGDECRCAQRRERYMRAYDALAQAGRGAVMAVNRIAVRGEEPSGTEERVNLVIGLRALARHLRLTELDD